MSKKILKIVGLGLFFLFILTERVNANPACKPIIPPVNPECTKYGDLNTWCTNFSDENCPTTEGCCYVAPEVKGGTSGTKCGLQTCGWLDISCLATYILTLPMRVVLFLIGAIGFGIALIIVWIGFTTLPGIIYEVIKASLELKYKNLQFLSTLHGAIMEISLSFIYLFLLIIALATILKIAEYEAKKTLVTLIIGALLISFSLIISTKVIEWGNDLTKALQQKLFPDFSEDFLGLKTIGSGFNDVLLSSVGFLGNIFCIDGRWEVYFEERNGEGPVIPMMILYAVFPWIVASVAMFILSSMISIGMVFLMRTVFFVALVAVSPIAFLTAAFRTKEMKVIFPGFLNWDDWWKTFLEWAFVGVSLVIWLSIAANIAKATIGGENIFLDTSVTTSTLATEMSTAQANVSSEPNFKKMTNEFSKPYEDLIKHLIPVLGAAAAIFLASVSAPKLGQQFAGAAFKFLNQVGSALVTGAIVGTAAVATAGATAAVGGLAKAKGAFGQMKGAIERRDWRGAGGAFVRGLGYTAATPFAGALAMGREAAKFGIAKMPRYVTRAVVPKEIREEIAKYPILKQAKQFPWAKEFIDGISGRVRGGLTGLAERHPQLFTFIFATPAIDVRRAADARNLARQYNISESEMRRILTAMLRRETRRRVRELPPSWQPPPPPPPPP